MIIFFCVFVVLCICSSKVITEKEGNTDYLSVETTQTVKGVFIILVFFNHFLSYAPLCSAADLFCKGIIGWFGQAMVTMFLFYSGYGVMESVKRKGVSYVNEIPKKRVLATLVKFDCAVLLYALLKLFLNESFHVTQFLLALVGWKSLGNSNWYIFVILMLYLITYVAFKLCRKQTAALSLVTVGICALCVVLAIPGGKEIHWYDTALCYAMGMLFSAYKSNLEAILLKNRMVYLIVLALLAFGVFRDYSFTPLGCIGHNCIFAAFVLVLTMRVSMRSKVLCWCGKHLFALYILQRIPMILFRYWGMAEYSSALYVACCAFVTVCMVYPFEFVTEELWAKLNRTASFEKN